MAMINVGWLIRANMKLPLAKISSLRPIEMHQEVVIVAGDDRPASCRECYRLAFALIREDPDAAGTP